MNLKFISGILFLSLFYSCSNDESETNKNEDVVKVQIENSVIKPVEEYEINDCDIKTYFEETMFYEDTVMGNNFFGGPITTNVNFPACHNNLTINDVSEVQPIFELNYIINFKFHEECHKASAYLEVSNNPGSLPIIGYGHINKKYPIADINNIYFKFNMNYILNCGDPSITDPTGPNSPFNVWTPYLIPYNYQYIYYPYTNIAGQDWNYIFGDKHFYHRVVIKIYDFCEDKYCNVVTNWKQFEWNI